MQPEAAESGVLRPAETRFPQPDMNGLVSDFDWSTTPLGPAAEWPDSLKVAVRILLTSRFAMWMAWGPELTFPLQRCLRSDDPWQEASLGARKARSGSVVRNLEGHRATYSARSGDRRGLLGGGTPSHSRTKRISGGDLPYVLLQPPGRPRWPDCGDALCRHRRYRSGDRRTAVIVPENTGLLH